MLTTDSLHSVLTRMNFFRTLLITVAFLLSLAACKNEDKSKNIAINQLQGRWTISEAWRNGRPTETLTDTFYEFDSEGTMKTNLTPLGEVEEFEFHVSGNLIKQKTEPEDVVYSVETLNDSVLTITMEIQKVPFRLKLSRQVIDSTEISEPLQ